jgi:uncharacterized protein (UPF0335 family)
MVKKADAAPKGDAPTAAPKPEPVREADLMQIGGNASAQLLSIVERVERIDEELEGIGADRKEVFAEAKGNGYDATIIAAVIRLRRMDPAKRQERDAILDLYETAIAEAEKRQRGETFGGNGGVDE